MSCTTSWSPGHTGLLLLSYSSLNPTFLSCQLWCALLLQTNVSYKPSNPNSAMIPTALLTAIVRKEASLPEHTAAFAATQLLPVILEATERYLDTLPGRHASLQACRELLVRLQSAGTHVRCCRSSTVMTGHAASWLLQSWRCHDAASCKSRGCQLYTISTYSLSTSEQCTM